MRILPLDDARLSRVRFIILAVLKLSYFYTSMVLYYLTLSLSYNIDIQNRNELTNDVYVRIVYAHI